MLVEYFVKRYAEKAGKQISKIDKNTLKLCQSYHWPGNIRELQNIVERSVILCTAMPFWIDEACSQAKRHLTRNHPLLSQRPSGAMKRNSSRRLLRKAPEKWQGQMERPPTRNSAVDAGFENQTAQYKETHHPVSASLNSRNPGTSQDPVTSNSFLTFVFNEIQLGTRLHSRDPYLDGRNAVQHSRDFDVGRVADRCFQDLRLRPTSKSRLCCTAFFHPSTDHGECKRVPNWISLKTKVKKEIGVTGSWEVPGFRELSEALTGGVFLYIELF